MPYILDENGNFALDKEGNKLEFTVEYINDDTNPFINNKTDYLSTIILEAWEINCAKDPLNRDDGALLPKEYLHLTIAEKKK